MKKGNYLYFRKTFLALHLHLFVFIMLALSYGNSLFAQGNLGLGTAAPDSSAILHMQSTDKGVLVPSMTTAQRDSISRPCKGLLIFNSANNRFEFNAGTKSAPNWVAIAGGGSFPPGTRNQTLRYNGSDWDSSSTLVNNGTNIGIGTTSPNTRLDINGAISLRDTTVNVNSDYFTITVANRSYFRINSNGMPSNRLIILSDGLQIGQIIILECITTGNNGFALNESVSNTNLSQTNLVIDHNDIIVFIWDGTVWMQLVYTSNG